MMEIQALQAELERLFTLDELLALSRGKLGLDPERVGGTSTKAAFASALAQYCYEQDAVVALCHAVRAVQGHTLPLIEQLLVRPVLHTDEVSSGDELGPYLLVRQLGEGRLGRVFHARSQGRDLRVKLLGKEATRDQGGLTTFLAAQRVVAELQQPGLPSGLTTDVVDGRVIVSHDFVEGQTLAAGLTRTGPVKVTQLRGLLGSLLEALQALHDRGLAHGHLHLNNLLLFRDEDGGHRVLLLDAASGYLRARPLASAEGPQFYATATSTATAAPEQFLGAATTPATDAYAFGALLYEIVTGQPPFAGNTLLDLARAHLVDAPLPPSHVAAPGTVGRDADQLILRLLAKDPAERPATASDILEYLEALAQTAQYRGPAPTEQELSVRMKALIANPYDQESALALEAALEAGADPLSIAKTFVTAGNCLDLEGDPQATSTKEALFLRAARLFTNAEEHERAEQLYAWLLEMDPANESYLKSLDKARRKLGKYDELIELLLHYGEHATTREARAHALGEIGKLYTDELNDPEQAILAYARAFSEDVAHTQFATELERLAGTNQQAWGEVIEVFNEALADDSLPEQARSVLLNRAGRWYVDKLNRGDLALPCFQAALEADPTDAMALEGVSALYRKNQSWQELGQVLLMRADEAPTPAKARDLRAEAAEVLEVHINDAVNARQLYEQVLQEDPGHEKANEALAQLYERAGDFQGLVRLLERQAQGLGGKTRMRVLCRIAETYETKLSDDAEAIRRFQAVIEQDPEYLEAYQGLERHYSKAGRSAELLENLNQQLQVASTPRQQLSLLVRVAALEAEELLDHAKAAETLERALTIDPEFEGALTALPKLYRTLERPEDVARTFERHLAALKDGPRRVAIALQLGKVLTEQVNDPTRAIAAYEEVLGVEPEHPVALEAVAKLQESSGDPAAAIQAIEALADKATSMEAKAGLLARAARLLRAGGETDAAIERYKQALDAHPSNPRLSAELRSIHLERGDANAALQMLEWELQATEGDMARAQLAGELAYIAHRELHDEAKAEESAKRALAFDPTNSHALIVMGDVAFEAERFAEASTHYGALVDRVEVIGEQEATRLLTRYIDALSRSGSTEKALKAVDVLLRIAPEDPEALLRVTQVVFEHGDPASAVELHFRFLDQFAAELDVGTQAVVSYRYGESLRRAGHLDEALMQLEEAADLDPSAPEPLGSLAQAHGDKGDWRGVLEVKNRHLDIASAEQRVQLLFEMGEVAADKLSDTANAVRCFNTALEEKPDDRRVLTRLMQLYGEMKDWTQLVEIVLRLAGFVDDAKQKAKYLSTAAMVTARELGDGTRALEFYREVVELDPSAEKAFNDAVALARQLGEFDALPELFEPRVTAAQERGDREAQLAALLSLADVYENELLRVDEAIGTLEAADKLEPGHLERSERLSRLYASDPGRYFDQAVQSQERLLGEDPYRLEPYKGLRKLYTDVRRADGSWVLCQALSVLKQADADEERFYKRMRSETAAPAQAVLAPEDWRDRLTHPDLDPTLTELFTIIEPTVVLARSRELGELGFHPAAVLDLATHPLPMPQTLYYAAGVLGLPIPPTYENPRDAGGLSFVHANPPSLGLGRAALANEVPPQAAAFVAARHLAYYRPGAYIRHLVPTGTGLKSWLFAAIKLISPQFPVGQDVAGPVEEARAALGANLHGTDRDALASAVSRLLSHGTPLDLKKWVAGVDSTADRVGLVLAHDLSTALRMVKASDSSATSLTREQREKELVVFSVSHQYLELRQRLGIAVGS